LQRRATGAYAETLSHRPSATAKAPSQLLTSVITRAQDRDGFSHHTTVCGEKLLRSYFYRLLPALLATFAVTFMMVFNTAQAAWPD
jgi:hypothetical protein